MERPAAATHQRQEKYRQQDINPLRWAARRWEPALWNICALFIVCITIIIVVIIMMIIIIVIMILITIEIEY